MADTKGDEGRELPMIFHQVANVLWNIAHRKIVSPRDIELIAKLSPQYDETIRALKSVHVKDEEVGDGKDQ